MALQNASTTRPAHQEALPGPAPLPAIPSQQLLGSEGKALILHEGQLYTLTRTKSGKLILTK